MSAENIITVDPALFIELVARQTNTLPQDYFNAIRAANLGIKVGEQRKLTRDAGQNIFPEDIVPTLPNSIFKVFIQISGVAAIVDLVKIYGTQRIAGKALDATPLAVNVPKEFNFPVSRDHKVNFILETAATIEIIEVIEFRIGQ